MRNEEKKREEIGSKKERRERRERDLRNGEKRGEKRGEKELSER